MRRVGKALLYAFVFLMVSIIVGTLGFSRMEGWSILDSLYMTVMTITTIGYGEVHELSDRGRAFTIVFMVIGASSYAFGISSLVQLLVHTELVGFFEQRRRVKEMSKLKDHFIVCGAGRVGRRVIREIQREGEPFIIIDNNPGRTAPYKEMGALVIDGDATLEETLREAGVDRAKGLVTCLPDDASNLYVVLTARDLNKGLRIVARGVEEQAEPKLMRAGATSVVSPTIIASHRMAQSLIKPAVAHFMDLTATEKVDLGFEQVEIEPSSIYAGEELKATNIRSELDIVIVAVRRSDGNMVFNPSGDTRIQTGDVLIAIGPKDSLLELARNAGTIS